MIVIGNMPSTPRCTIACPEPMEPHEKDAETTESTSTKRDITKILKKNKDDKRRMQLGVTTQKTILQLLFFLQLQTLSFYCNCKLNFFFK